MNDNATWERATFTVPGGDVDNNVLHWTLTIEGLTRGPFGVFCYDYNDVPHSRYRRVSLTHLPTGRVIAHTHSGATALRLGDALMDLAGEFLRPMTPAHRRKLGPKVEKIVHAHGALMGRQAA